MLIGPKPKLNSHSASPAVPPEAPKESDDNTWNELFSSELNEIGIHLDPAHIKSTLDGAHSVGNGLRNTWDQLSEKITKVFDLDKDGSLINENFRERATQVALQVAKTVGFAAAGIQGLGGIIKLASGIKRKNLGRKIDGSFDLVTAAAIGTTVAGLPLGPTLLGPLAAVLGVTRGSFNAGKGFLEAKGRKEIQGALDATRSASVGLRLMGARSAMAGVAGAYLGPVAGAIQVTRGYYDLSAGLETKDFKKQFHGLSDMASAAGLTMAATGIGTIPGIAITVLAMGSRLLYQFNDSFQSRSDSALTRLEPKLRSAVKGVDSVTQPIILKARKLIEKTFGRDRGQQAS